MPTVLLLEDEDLLRTDLVEVLRVAGFKTVEAANGEIAEKVLKTGQIKIDLAVLDMSMPGKDGMEIIDFMLRYHPKIPVISMSGDFSGVEIFKNVYKHLKKPFDFSIMPSEIKAALS